MRDAAGSSSSPTKTRICKKLVVKGHASSSGASYTLFLKVQVLTCDLQRSYELLFDPAVHLQDAIVHRLDASGAAPALSTSAATAASSLGIPLSIDHEMNDSFIEHMPKKGGQTSIPPRPSDPPGLPAVIRSDDGTITIRTPSPSSPKSKRAATSQQDFDSYMITLHLKTEPLSKPSFAPFAVRLAVPVCLNNFMRFTVDESIDSDFSLQGMAVEVDPPILPIVTARKPLRRRSSTPSSHRASSIESFSDDEADVTLLASESINDAEYEQDDTAIVGPFHACDAVVIRIAAQQSGDLIASGPVLRVLPNALRAMEVVSSTAYQSVASKDLMPVIDPEGALHDGSRRVTFDATLQLREPYFPGLDREVQLYVQLEPAASVVDWRPLAVDASRGILSWSFGRSASTSSSPTQLPQITAGGARGPSPTFEIGDLVVLPEPSQQGTDDEDLLSVAPPKGLNDADLDYSLDNVAPPSTEHRRFSLQSSTSTKNLPSQPPSEPSESASTPGGTLAITFSLLPVLQSKEPLIVTVRGTLTLADPLATPLQSRDLNILPHGLFVPAATKHIYQQPKLSGVETMQLQSHYSNQLQESLDDSRETEQPSQSHEKPGTMRQDLTMTAISGDAKTEEILRQALAIIAAHNESLTNARKVNPRAGGQQKSGNHWMLSASHLLWTLFLTATIFMLFNASQTANQALSAKLDELSRIVEVSNRVNCLGDVHASDFAAGIVSPYVTAMQAEEDEPQLVEIPTAGDDLYVNSPGPAAYLDQGTDSLLSGQAALQPSKEHDLSHYVFDWLRDLLRMPVDLIRAFFDILLGA